MLWDMRVSGAWYWYENQDIERLIQIKKEIENIDTNIKIYGAECKYA